MILQTLSVNSTALLVFLAVILIFIAGPMIAGNLQLSIFWFEVVFTYLAVETEYEILWGLWLAHVIIVGLSVGIYMTQFVFGSGETHE